MMMSKAWFSFSSRNYLVVNDLGGCGVNSCIDFGLNWKNVDTASYDPDTGVLTITSAGHGLNSAPEQVWYKRRGTTGNWMNYVKAMGGDGYINLDRNNGKDTGGSPVNNVDPSSTVITLGSFQSLNSGGGDADADVGEKVFQAYIYKLKIDRLNGCYVDCNANGSHCNPRS